MTRLDPPPHRPNPRAWTDDSQSRDIFSRHSGLKEDREKRESGYFSLGRAASARSLHDSSPPAPFRHFERGHPIFSNRNVEPKDIVPFRNPNLGVASQRPIPEAMDEDVDVEIPPPDPYEIAVEVEAQVGPRSPSPTPFKIAESLASSRRKGFGSSYGRVSPSSPVSSYQQSGSYNSPRQSSALQSRSSSPSRGNSTFRRSESIATLSRTDFDGGGRSPGREPGSRSSLQGAHGRRIESGTLPRNFKSFASSVKSQSSMISDFRSTLRKTEANGSLSGRGGDSRSSSPQRKDFNSSSQMPLHKTETSTSLSRGRVYNSRTSSPSRRTSDSRSSSPPRRTYSSSSQSLLHKSESVMSLNGRSHHGRCGSPIREGYDIESQALLRNPSVRNGLKDQEQEVPIHPSPSKRGQDTPSHSILRKTESSPARSSRGRDSRSSSPGRRGYDNPSRYQLKKTDTGGSLHGRSRESHNSPPLRKSYETTTQPLLHKSEFNSSVRSHDRYSSSSLRRTFDASDQRLAHKPETSSSFNSRNQNSRNSSPSRKDSSQPPGYSVLRSAINGDSGHFFQRKNTHSDTKSNSDRSPRSWRESTHSLRSSSLSRAASPSRHGGGGNRSTAVTLERPRSPGSNRSSVGRNIREDRCPSPNDKRTSRHPESPSLHIQIQRHTSSQSSMESSESGRLSVGSTGRNREAYAMMADVPKVKMIHHSEASSHAGRLQNQQSVRRQELFKPASHSLSKLPSREWEDTGDTEREWHSGGTGYLSRAHSSTSLQRSGSPTADEGSSWKGYHHRSEQMQELPGPRFHSQALFVGVVGRRRCSSAYSNMDALSP
ncbi:serine/arginine repetitive matrix protein 2 [Oreochromis niloticus]|uniref:serine/arginine repetitive matrix protein 2 n=1 Tax=Oreochromis niloticus TaxID=8128 RepID=UPI000DF161E3|nr:serine/arginine repetitive matrix protein 2-like [Oreochromis niloticus]